MYQIPLPNNLPTFRVLYIVKGCLSFFGCFIWLFYAAFGAMFFEKMSAQPTYNPPPFDMGMLFVVVGTFGFVISLTLGILNLFAAKYIKETRKYTFIYVMAVISCIGGILGILLGVFTIIELNKPHIKAMFYPNATPENSPL